MLHFDRLATSFLSAVSVFLISLGLLTLVDRARADDLPPETAGCSDCVFCVISEISFDECVTQPYGTYPGYCRFAVVSPDPNCIGTCGCYRLNAAQGYRCECALHG